MAKPILVEIFGDASQFTRELNKATGSTKRFGATAKLAGGIAAVALAVGIEKSVKAAVEAEAATKRLDQAFHNAGLSTKTYTEEIDAAEAAGRKLGFTDEDTKNSMASLVTATNDVSAATKAMGVAQDVARFKHVDLEAATKTLTMAMAGSKRALTALGVPLIAVTTNVDKLKASNEDLSTAEGKADLAHAKLLDKMATGQAIIDATSDRIHGQAKAFADSAAGGMAQFNAQLEHLEVALGTLVLPALVKLINHINNVAAQLNTQLGPSIKTVTEALRTFGFLVPIVGGYLSLFIKVQLLPLKLAIMAVTVAVEAVTKAFNVMKTAATAVAGFFSGVFHGAVTGGRAVVSALDTALDGVKGAFNAVKSAASSVAGFVGGGLTKALNAFKPVANAVKTVINAIASALQAAASAAQFLAHALSLIKVPSIHLPSLPHIPGLQAGGPVRKGMSYVVGERGPELFTAGATGFVTPNLSVAGGGGGVVVNVTVHGSVMSERDLALSIRDEIVRAGNRSGGSMFAGTA